MALFYNYKKDGKGVSREESEAESVWALYFLIVKRNLSKFIKLNLIYVALAVLCAVVMYFVMILPSLLGFINIYGIGIKITETFALTFNPWVLYAVPIPMVIFSPLFGGGMVVSRRMANREYVFLLSEYIDGVKDNWKQFLANSIISYLVYVLMSFALVYYYANLSSGIIYWVLFFILVFFASLFIFAQFYIPLMIVSVDLKLSHIYKNGFLLAVLGFVRNILFIILISIYVAFYLFFALSQVVTIIIATVTILLIAFSFFSYSQAYICYPIVKKYIIDPFYVPKEEPKEEVVEKVDAITNGEIVIDEKIFDDV